jgi:vitamin B12/bleomycin/antimicrobial peptide transport system ATP-binding/permease protein
MAERERPPEHRDDGRPGSSGSARSGAHPAHGPGPPPDDDPQSRQYLIARFWDAALGFWRAGGGRVAWPLTLLVLAVALVNLGVQYRLNLWHRAMFDALDTRDGGAVLRQTLTFFPLIAVAVGIAAGATWAKMTLQRRWRAWLNGHVLDQWLTTGRYYQLNLVPGDHSNPEHRVGEDLRLSVDAPVEFSIGIFSAVSSAIVFIGVLWSIGGELAIPIAGATFRIPGFLVVAAIVYALVASGAMVGIARGFVAVSENKNQAEAEYRYGLTRVRENGESIALLGGDQEERAGLDTAFGTVRARWRALMMQYIRTTVVSQASTGIAPIIPILLCAPKYVAGTMSLGEVMQASSAFLIVQTSFGWLVENYPRLADWTASASRLASLLVSLDRLERAERDEPSERIVRTRTGDNALRLRNVSVTLDDGSGVVNEADLEIGPGEKVLVVGESGTGKSTLVRAIAGLWPWGTGEIEVKFEGLSLMPQKPYVPLGTLRKAVTYPLPPDDVDDAVVRAAVEEVGLGYLLPRLDEDTTWEHVLSGGEKQRLAFARVLIQRSDTIVMDEATAALDVSSQEDLMRLLLARLPDATVISVGHRPELEAFHTRKLVLEYRADGARVVRDETLRRTVGRSARLLSQLPPRRRRRRSGTS